MLLDEAPDGCDRLVEPLGDLAIGALERVRARRSRVELGREPRAIGIEGMNLRSERRMTHVMLEPPLDRALEQVECGLQASCRHLDRTCIDHAPPRRSPRLLVPGIQNCLRGNML
jgi:hypothetical protein